LEYRLLSAYQEGGYASLTAAFSDGEMSIMLLQASGFASLIAFMASAVLIIKWIYRANYNAHQLGAKNMKYTPAWSVGYYFIPVFNLWKPYQAMKEIWMASKNPFDWRSVKVSALLPSWWALWLISNLLNQYIFRFSATAQELPELLKLNMLSQTSNVLHIPLALVTLLLINAIYRMQSGLEE
ncbi:MAG: DUF4328 domain-containing protein, partial [Psychromonas sp.]|nr:DUF4328 domain-containing protein [Psychromonas sp.]